MSIPRRWPSALIAALAVIVPAVARATELVGPVTFGSPDQPFSVRRAVTAADRARIRQYRARTPTFAANFASAAALDAAFNRDTDD